MPNSGFRLPTINDVAKLAGVSVPTVSRVLNGSVPVSAEKQKRVREAVEKLGYRPLAAAQALASSRTKTIGVLTANTRRHGYVETLEGIETGARNLGYSTVIHLMREHELSSVSEVISGIMAQKTAGIVILGFDRISELVIDSLPASIPVVIAGSGGVGSKFPRAYIDEYQAAYQLVTSLLENGHKTVAHIKLPEVTKREDARTTAWRDALHDKGADVPVPLCGQWDAETGYRLAEQLCTQKDITAVFCGNDEIAIGLIAGLREHHVKVPDDVSVIGFDNHPLSGYVFPPLTTAYLDFVEMGRRASHLVIREIATETDNQELVEKIDFAQASQPVVAQAIFRSSTR